MRATQTASTPTAAPRRMPSSPCTASCCCSPSVAVRALFRLARGREDLAVAVRRHGGHETRILHLLQEPRGAVIADAQVPLHERNRRAPVLDHDLDRLIVQGIGLAIG